MTILLVCFAMIIVVAIGAVIFAGAFLAHVFGAIMSAGSALIFVLVIGFILFWEDDDEDDFD